VIIVYFYGDFSVMRLFQYLEFISTLLLKESRLKKNNN